jgi:hypothetical protein
MRTLSSLRPKFGTVHPRVSFAEYLQKSERAFEQMKKANGRKIENNEC